MELDFELSPGKCQVMQKDHVEDLVSSFSEDLRRNSPTPAAADLFQLGAGGLLCAEKKKMFQTCVAKGLFISKRSRPDIVLPISVLSSRVREPSKDD